jgi:hypothetical protein
MKYRVVLAVLLVSMFFFLLFWRLEPVKEPSKPDFFVGVDAVSDNVEDIKRHVDEVKSYTNLFVIGSTGIIYNLTKLDDVCQYIYDSGLYFMTFFHIKETIPQVQWVADAKQRWGDRFVGLYAYDEAGGHQIDEDRPYMLVEEADNYTDAANKFVKELGKHLKNITDYPVYAGELPLFTADYGLYWFDYEAGYDVVLCEFGWNHSRLLNVALNRGAARMQNKDWGVIITWTYWDPPYIESGDELYYDMILAYLNGAKYLVVFNRPEENGSLTETLTAEHLDAMKRFWRYIQANPRRPEIYCSTCAQTVYILPKDYGWGFRGSEDKVWGLWLDDLSTKIGTDLNYLLHTHHVGLDIIYDDPKYYNEMRTYSKVYFWNGTVLTNDNKQ